MIPQRFFGFVRFDFFKMFMRILNRTVSSNNFCRRLFSNTRNSRNIICCISHQGLQFNNLRWCHLIRLKYFFCVIIFYLCFSALSLWNSDQHMICSKLQKITVTGQNCRIYPFLFCHSRNGSQQIICLISFHCNNGYLHCRQNLLDQRNLFPQFFRHGFSCTFICIIHFMAKCRCMKVKRNRQIFRFFFFQHLRHNI